MARVVGGALTRREESCVIVWRTYLLFSGWFWLEVERGGKNLGSSNYSHFDHLGPVATEVIVWLAELVATEAGCQSSIVIAVWVYMSIDRVSLSIQ